MVPFGVTLVDLRVLGPRSDFHDFSKGLRAGYRIPHSPKVEGDLGGLEALNSLPLIPYG